jgi:hypothetical protein
MYSPEKASTLARRNIRTGNTSYQEEFVPHKAQSPNSSDDYIRKNNINVVGKGPSSFVSTNAALYSPPPKDVAEWSSPNVYRPDRTIPVYPPSPEYFYYFASLFTLVQCLSNNVKKRVSITKSWKTRDNPSSSLGKIRSLCSWPRRTCKPNCHSISVPESKHRKYLSLFHESPRLGAPNRTQAQTKGKLYTWVLLTSSLLTNLQLQLN